MPRVLNKLDKSIEDQSRAVYVGRPSKWGNPFVIGKDGSREDVIRLYRQYLMSSPELLESLGELRDKDLVCWCAPKVCHADVLLELANTRITGEADALY